MIKGLVFLGKTRVLKKGFIIYTGFTLKAQVLPVYNVAFFTGLFFLQ